MGPGSRRSRGSAGVTTGTLLINGRYARPDRISLPCVTRASWNLDLLIDKLKYSRTNQDFFDAMNTRTGRRALRRARC
jgi:hypothetical protein